MLSQFFILSISPHYSFKVSAIPQQPGNTMWVWALGSIWVWVGVCRVGLD